MKRQRPLRAKCWLTLSVLMLPLRLFPSCLRQQMAKTAEVLPPQRKLRLAQRVQNTPQSWYTNPKDCRVNLKEILHRSCKLCLWKKDVMSPQLTALFPACASFSARNLHTVVSILQTNPEILNSALRRPGAGRQLCRN